MSRRAGGFTMVELMVAMSLFLVLGTGLVALLTNAFDFLRAGTAGSEMADKGADFLRPFTMDLENVLTERGLDPGPSSIRFHSDFVPVPETIGPDKEVDFLAQRLVFVRSTTAEAADPLGRQAGMKAGAEAYLDGKDDAAEAKDGKLRAPGGMQEISYMTLAGSEPGVLNLYRATRSPVGGTGSLFDVKKAEEMKKAGQPLLAGVLHFAVRFWTPQTTSWDVSNLSGDVTAPSLTWDSTRAILPSGFGMKGFPLALGEGSLNDPRDDVSPRMVRVTIIYERTGRENLVGYLQDAINDGSKKLVLNSTAFANTSNLKYVKVDTEWMQYSGLTSTRISIVRRGVWGTMAVAHPAGAKVRAGYVVERSIMIPSYRENWNFR